MRFFLLTVVAAATIGLAAGQADARSLQIPHKPWTKMTKHQKIVVLRKQIHKDHSVIRFWHNHRNLAVSQYPVAEQARTETHWARVSLRIATRNLHRLLVASRPTYTGGYGVPPHYRGWMCIHRGEGAWNSNTGNGYYGGLQMTAGWYGGNGHLASSDPPLVQMWAAERGLIASHYSHAWLAGQWPNTYPPCAGYF